LKAEKQVAIGWRRASTILALGRMAKIRPVARLTLDAGAREEAFAERAQAVTVEVGNRFRVLRDIGARLSSRQFARDGDDLGQLHGAFHLGVAGEDLLDQGRARTRQAHDKDRIGVCGALPFARREKFSGEQRLRSFDARGHFLGVVVDLAAPDLCARGVVFERLAPAAGVL
jgi:hypothetical protein